MTSLFAPGCGVPWPDPRRYPVVRRLLALWRWEYERGPESDAAQNARRSLVNRTAALVPETEWLPDSP